VVDALKKLPERNRFVRGLVSWVGFRQTDLLYERDARFAGETKYPFLKMLPTFPGSRWEANSLFAGAN
jgi:hypothetical protein